MQCPHLTAVEKYLTCSHTPTLCSEAFPYQYLHSLLSASDHLDQIIYHPKQNSSLQSDYCLNLYQLHSCFPSLSSSLSLVLMWRMACQWVAVLWTLRLARVLVWCFRPTSPTVSAASLSSTAPTQTSTFPLKPCPATRPPPATCEYLNEPPTVKTSFALC